MMPKLNQSSPVVDNTGCRSGFWYDNKTDLCRRKEYDYLDWDDVAATMFIIVSFLSVLLNLLVLGIFIRNRKTPVVKAANRELSFLLLGLLLIAFLVPLTHIGIPTKTQCVSHIVIQGPLLTGILSIFLVKTHRVISIFSAKQPKVTSRQWFLGQRLQLVAVFALVIVQVLLVTIYVLANPPEVLEIGLEDISTRYVYVECSYGGAVVFGLTYIYVVAIALLGFIFALRSRHLPSNFRESRHIAASLATTLVVFVTLLPASPTTHGRTNAILTILTLAISPLGQLSFLFFPKCYIILFCPHRNTVQELRRMTLAHMQRRSELNLNSPTMPRLNIVDQICAEDADADRETPLDGVFDFSERTRRERNARTVCFIEDEYTAATGESSESREILSITLHARATIEGISRYGIHGIDNLAFIHDTSDSKQSSLSSTIGMNQDTRPRSISAEETAEREKKARLEHLRVGKRRSEPILNSWSTLSSVRGIEADEVCFSLSGTLSASATLSPSQGRANTKSSTFHSPTAMTKKLHTKKGESTVQSTHSSSAESLQNQNGDKFEKDTDTENVKPKVETNNNTEQT